MAISEEEIKRLRFDERKSFQEIADISGCSRQNIQQRLSKYGISFRSPSKKDLIKKYLEENTNTKTPEVAKRFNVTESYISSIRTTFMIPKNTQYNFFWNYVDISNIEECWNWKGSKFPSGYGHISHKLRYSHRVAWEKTFGRIPKGLHILHKCDNPSCCNPNHLFLGTHQDNMRDRDIKGRCAKSRLTIDQVKEIKKKLKDNHKTRKIAKEFNVSYSIVYNIKTERTYKYI